MFYNRKSTQERNKREKRVFGRWNFVHSIYSEGLDHELRDALIQMGRVHAVSISLAKFISKGEPLSEEAELFIAGANHLKKLADKRDASAADRVRAKLAQAVSA